MKGGAGVRGEEVALDIMHGGRRMVQSWRRRRRYGRRSGKRMSFFFFFFYMNPLCSSSQDHYTWHFCVRFRGRVRFADERLYAKKREGRFRRIRKREVAVFYVQM